MANISFKKINKIYEGNAHAVHDFDLDVNDGEFVVFVGPSGCGKSTTLRMLAGLEEITSGELYIDDVLVNTVAPKDRDIAMVFQNYALYPHMSVYENIAFSLRIRKEKKEEIKRRVLEAADILGLNEYLYRKPKALSGGQRQRVALGRAIVRKPKVFLMDEPLSNLDAKLRVQMRSEITKIHERVGATTIYVTHDQTEAMTMADRVVIMKDGFVQQIGTPKEIYDNPNNVFVATFIGAPAMNVLSGVYKNGKFTFNDSLALSIKSTKKIKEHYEALQNRLLVERGKLLEEIDNLSLDKQNKKITNQINILNEKRNIIDEKLEKVNNLLIEGNIDMKIGIRPEDIRLATDKRTAKINLDIDHVELLGRELVVYSSIEDNQIIIKTSAKENIEEKKNYSFTFSNEDVLLFDIEDNRIFL